MKPAIRSIRSVCRPVLLVAFSVWVSACSRESQNEGGASRPPGSVVGSQTYVPDAPPARWAGLIGEYGPDDDVWLVLEDESSLHLRQGEVAYALQETSADEFLGRPPGADEAERVLFTRRA
ncbi:MAG: hypothetical protein IIB37_03655, partial [Gemmatimonadetes bacterium]|nr:hypothetical protein [Gemmatimonadota bacterium]